ncbi:MAG: lipoate--protein ligase [Bacteroidales bacterium]|nr:lipoate--protein ligase [Bacteroidales bacterium]
MRIVHRPHTNPYFNLAAEEYLLKKMNQDCFMLWRNEPCVVVGKHQNTFSEINHQFVKDKNLPVIRRISGGGTVVHDPGNINFTFISEGKREKLVDFKKFTLPIIDFLNNLNVPAKFEGKNDIRVEGLKISGNAEHVYKNKVLHHGTLLFSSDLKRLNQSINVNPDLFLDKGVRSVRSKVSNLQQFLPESLSIEAFINQLTKYVSKQFSGIEHYDLNDEDIAQIESLVKDKYSTWEWNYGYSPPFTFIHQLKINKVKHTIELIVKEGLLMDFKVQPLNEAIISKLNSMINHPFNIIGLNHLSKI